MEYRGIDVSKYQGNIDFKQVKDSGVEFVIIRIGYGMYENQKDPKFEEYYQNAINNALPVGVYLYSYALNVSEAEREADTVLNWLNNRNLNLPVYYDIEDKTQTTLSKQTLTEMCSAFCKKIEEAGYWAGIYANKYWLTTHLDSATLEQRFTIWVAQYNTVNTYDGKYDMWQYTSSGKVNGISGNVDMNILYRDIFSNREGSNTPDTPETNTLPNLSNYTGDSIVDALKSVGYDSSFDSRKKLYEEAGFTDNYTGTAVQNLNLLKRLQGNYESSYYPRATYKGLSFVDGLKSIGVDSSFTNRTKIASKNGISNYTGSIFQNLKLLNLLKKGELKR